MDKDSNPHNPVPSQGVSSINRVPPEKTISSPLLKHLVVVGEFACNDLPDVTAVVSGRDAVENNQFIRTYDLRLNNISAPSAQKFLQDLHIDLETDPGYNAATDELSFGAMRGFGSDINDKIVGTNARFTEQGHNILPVPAIITTILADCSKYAEQYGRIVDPYSVGR